MYDDYEKYWTFDHIYNEILSGSIYNEDCDNKTVTLETKKGMIQIPEDRVYETQIEAKEHFKKFLKEKIVKRQKDLEELKKKYIKFYGKL